MKILYADCALRTLEGHHASLGVALPASFRRLGHDVTVLGHVDLLPDLQHLGGQRPSFAIIRTVELPWIQSRDG